MMRSSFLGAFLGLSACVAFAGGCGGTGNDATNTGGSSAGGSNAGGSNAGGSNAGGSSAGGSNAGGTGEGGTGAGGTGAGSEQPSAQELYGPDIKTIVIEVDYAEGAEPFTGAGAGMSDTWDLFDKNAARLFEGGNKALTVPHTLDQMEKLTDISGEDFTGKDIIAIAGKHRNEKNTASQATFYIVWLPGYYNTKDGRQENTLGVSFGGTGVIGMFKPVIDGSGGIGDLIPRFVEQITLIHEFGHAAGLVNNGVAMTTEHQDVDHGKHCTNKDCVMYYAVEGATDIAGYVQDAIASGDTDLFGAECLDDAHAALAGK